MKNTIMNIINVILMVLMVGVIMHAQVGACRTEMAVVFFAMVFNCTLAIIDNYRMGA